MDNEQRLCKIENDISNVYSRINELAIAQVEIKTETKTEIKYMSSKIDNIDAKIDSLSTDMKMQFKEISEKPAKRYDYIIMCFISALFSITGGLVTYFMTRR